jgi:hypothetical protein
MYLHIHYHNSCHFSYIIRTERCGRVVNTFASYSGGPAGGPVIPAKVFRDFPHIVP